MSKGQTTDDMIRHYRREIEQLRYEASIPRVRISECMQNLLEYSQNHGQDDFLVSSIPPPGTENPFQEKKKCDML